MKQAHIIVEHVDETPGDIPAIWRDEPSVNGDRCLHLWVRRDMPKQVEDYLRTTAVRDCLPSLDLTSYTITTEPVHVTAFAVA